MHCVMHQLETSSQSNDVAQVTCGEPSVCGKVPTSFAPAVDPRTRDRDIVDLGGLGGRCLRVVENGFQLFLRSVGMGDVGNFVLLVVSSALS